MLEIILGLYINFLIEHPPMIFFYAVDTYAILTETGFYFTNIILAK